MSKCTTLRFKIYSRDYDKLKKYANDAGVSPQSQARLWVQRQVAMLPAEPEERDLDFKLEHLKSALEHWGFSKIFTNRDEKVIFYWFAKILSKDIFVIENPNGVFLDYGTGRDLIPNYHSFPHILRRRINLLVSHHTIRPQYTSEDREENT